MSGERRLADRVGDTHAAAHVVADVVAFVAADLVGDTVTAVVAADRVGDRASMLVQVAMGDGEPPKQKSKMGPSVKRQQMSLSGMLSWQRAEVRIPEAVVEERAAADRCVSKHNKYTSVSVSAADRCVSKHNKYTSVCADCGHHYAVEDVAVDDGDDHAHEIADCPHEQIRVQHHGLGRFGDEVVRCYSADLDGISRTW